MKKTLFSAMAALAVLMLFTTTQSIAAPLSAGIVYQEDYYLEDEQLYSIGEDDLDEMFKLSYEDFEEEMILSQLYADEDFEEELIAQLYRNEDSEEEMILSQLYADEDFEEELIAQLYSDEDFEEELITQLLYDETDEYDYEILEVMANSENDLEDA